MFQSFRVGLDDAVCAVNGQDDRDSEFCSLLNDPVHLVAFDQGLAEHDRWVAMSRFDLLLDNAAVDGLWGDMGHFHAIADAASVVEDEGVPWAQAETITKMMEKITGHADCRWSNGARVDKEGGHGTEAGRWPIALFEEGFHLVKEAVAILFHRHAALFGKFFE